MSERKRDWKQESKEDAHEVVRQFSHWINNMSHHNSDSVEAVMSEHRTLQQQMFETMLACMEAWAKQEHYDARNEYTVLKCREIMEHQRGRLFPSWRCAPRILSIRQQRKSDYVGRGKSIHLRP